VSSRQVAFVLFALPRVNFGRT